jgi:hypothetical protein
MITDRSKVLWPEGKSKSPKRLSGRQKKGSKRVIQRAELSPYTSTPQRRAEEGESAVKATRKPKGIEEVSTPEPNEIRLLQLQPKELSFHRQ